MSWIFKNSLLLEIVTILLQSLNNIVDNRKFLTSTRTFLGFSQLGVFVVLGVSSYLHKLHNNNNDLF